MNIAILSRNPTAEAFKLTPEQRSAAVRAAKAMGLDRIISCIEDNASPGRIRDRIKG